MPSGPNRDPKGNPFLKKTVEFGLAALPEGNADPPFYSPRVNRIRGFQKYTQVFPPPKKKGFIVEFCGNLIAADGAS
ncbi:MAG: hypothetical protein ACP5I4_06340 [Oceanipulchritudo sp.]